MLKSSSKMASHAEKLNRQTHLPPPAAPPVLWEQKGDGPNEDQELGSCDCGEPTDLVWKFGQNVFRYVCISCGIKMGGTFTAWQIEEYGL